MDHPQLQTKNFQLSQKNFNETDTNFGNLLWFTINCEDFWWKDKIFKKRENSEEHLSLKRENHSLTKNFLKQKNLYG